MLSTVTALRSMARDRRALKVHCWVRRLRGGRRWERASHPPQQCAPHAGGAASFKQTSAGAQGAAEQLLRGAGGLRRRSTKGVLGRLCWDISSTIVGRSIRRLAAFEVWVPGLDVQAGASPEASPEVGTSGPEHGKDLPQTMAEPAGA